MLPRPLAFLVSNCCGESSALLSQQHIYNISNLQHLFGRGAAAGLNGPGGDALVRCASTCTVVAVGRPSDLKIAATSTSSGPSTAACSCTLHAWGEARRRPSRDHRAGDRPARSRRCAGAYWCGRPQRLYRPAAAEGSAHKGAHRAGTRGRATADGRSGQAQPVVRPQPDGEGGGRPTGAVGRDG